MFQKRGRFWAVHVPNPDGTLGPLVCLCVYKCGAREVLRRLGYPHH